MIGVLWLNFIIYHMRCFPAQVEPSCDPSSPIAARESHWATVLRKRQCCIGDPGFTEKLTKIYTSPTSISRPDPQSMLQCWVCNSEAQSIPVERRHLWQSMADNSTNGRSLSLESLNSRFASRDICEDRVFMERQAVMR